MIGIADAGAGRDLHLCAAARRARAAVALRARADPRRGVRQPDRSRDRRATSWTSSTSTGARRTSGPSTSPTPPSPSGPSSCCSRWSGSDAAMHPILFDFGGFTIYAYGVLLAAAYLLGLQFALVRARARGLDASGSWTSGIWIIISALVGAKLLLLIVDFKQFTQNPRELLGLARSGGVFYGGLIAAVVVALCLPAAPQAAAVDDHRRVRARHRARPRRRPAGLPVGGLLLRQADVGAVGDHVPRSRGAARTWARRSACRSIRRSSTKRAPSADPRRSCWRSSGGAGRFPGRTFWSYMLLYGISRFVIEFYRGDSRGMVFDVLSTSQFVSVLLVPLAIVMLVVLSRRRIRRGMRRRSGRPRERRPRRTSRRARSRPNTTASRLDSFLAALLPDRSAIAAAEADQGRPRHGARRRRCAPARRCKAGQTFAVTLPEAGPATAVAEDLPLDHPLRGRRTSWSSTRPAGMVVHPAAGHSSGTRGQRAAPPRRRSERRRRPAAAGHRAPPRSRHVGRDGRGEERRGASGAVAPVSRPRSREGILRAGLGHWCRPASGSTRRSAATRTTARRCRRGRAARAAP